MREIDHYFLYKDEPVKSYLFALRTYILAYDKNIAAWKYKMPFYCYHGKMFCYLWVPKNFISLISELWKERKYNTRNLSRRKELE